MDEQKTSFTLILVRHGQGRHNLGKFTKDQLEFTNDDKPPTIDEPLTETGLRQARLVGERLATTRIDLAISSDLKRARQTGEAIVEANDSVDELLEWEVVRERNGGIFEGDKGASDNRSWCEHRSWSLCTDVLRSVGDEEYLTWRPPNGESVKDLRNRVREFLGRLRAEAVKLRMAGVEDPTIMVATHQRFMVAVYVVLSSSEAGRTMPREIPFSHNTGIDRYRLTYDNEDGLLEEATCDMRSCARHLENRDDGYDNCCKRCCRTRLRLVVGLTIQ